ncbi:MAG: alpha/beta hydrolase [Acidobacteriaceae bacterium]
MAKPLHRSAPPSLAHVLRLRREAIANHPRRYMAALLLCLTVLVAVDAALLWPYARARLQAVAVLDRVAGDPVPRSLAWVVSEPVRRTDLLLALPSGTLRARLYTPADHPHAPGVVVVHGVHYLGIDEPRIIEFAAAMASCGVQVLTPELPGIKDYRVGANSIADIGESAIWLDHATGNRPVGVMGISFSGSLSLLAATEPQFRPAIRFVAAVGSEDEMARVANYYLTGREPRPDGSVEMLPPHEYGSLVLEYENLQDFVPAADLAAVRLALREHLYEDRPAERAAMQKLSPRQLAEVRQLMDTASPVTRRMIAASNALHQAEMAAVSPEGHLAKLATPVYLLSGRADNIIPSAETQWLERQIPRQEIKMALISPVISHIDVSSQRPTFGDKWRLVRFFALIMHAAED